jgi:thiamine-monophosphate kinase
VSDGLVQDAGHLAAASEVALSIQLFSLPLSPQLSAVLGDRRETRIAAAQAGDDYQILFAAPVRKRTAIESLARKHIVRVTRIGAVAPGKGVRVLDAKGRNIQLKKAGYTHF